MKTHFLFLLLGLFFMSFSQAQEEEIEEKKLKMGVHFTPGIVNLIYEDADLGEIDRTISFKLGFDIFYKLSDRIELKTGLTGQLINLKQTDYSISLPCDITSSSINFRNSWYTDHYLAQYLGIPLEARFNLTTGKNIFFYKLGVEGQLKLRSKGSRRLIECKARFNHPFVPANEMEQLLGNINTGFGYEFHLAENKLMYFEGQGSISTNKIFIDGPTMNNSRLLNLGLTVGVRQ